MNEQRVRGLLGMAARARQITFGQDLCLEAIRKGKAAVALLDEAAAANTAKKIRDACTAGDTPLLVLPEGLLEDATGKSGRMTAVMIAGGLADGIRSEIR